MVTNLEIPNEIYQLSLSTKNVGKMSNPLPPRGRRIGATNKEICYFLFPKVVLFQYDHDKVLLTEYLSKV